MFTASGAQRNDLRPEGRKIVRSGGRQILLIEAGGCIFAIANRCPHEGYPLSDGSLGPGCALTCNWHNWKFDLATGKALAGRDPVRTYPTELRGGEIFIDISDPPAETQRKRALDGLDTALTENDMARMAREMARLERAGSDAAEALSFAIQTRNSRLEDGMTHAHAAAADWLLLAERAPSPEMRLTALLEPVAHLSNDTLGAGKFPYENGVREWNAPAFAEAVEAEDEPNTIRLIRGALAESIPYEKLRPVFAEAALAHYADFGHCAIYTLKAGHLLSRLGADVSESLLLALTRRIVRARREERLREFRFYGKALSAWDRAGGSAARAEVFIGASVERALKLALASSARPRRELYDALLGAAAWNMLHFDRSFERATDGPIADNVNWLDFTHALTFANACRHICGDRLDLWPRALLQLALFVGRNRKYIDAGQDANCFRVNDRKSFLAREMAALYDHGIPEPIVACHRLKTLCALEDELAAAPDAPWADEMCAAVNRYLNTPLKRHHGLRTAVQAREFVAREG